MLQVTQSRCLLKRILKCLTLAVFIDRPLMLDCFRPLKTGDRTCQIPSGFERCDGGKVRWLLIGTAEASSFRSIIMTGNPRVARALALRWLAVFLFADRGKISEGNDAKNNRQCFTCLAKQTSQSFRAGRACSADATTTSATDIATFVAALTVTAANGYAATARPGAAATTTAAGVGGCASSAAGTVVRARAAASTASTVTAPPPAITDRTETLVGRRCESRAMMEESARSLSSLPPTSSYSDKLRIQNLGVYLPCHLSSLPPTSSYKVEH